MPSWSRFWQRLASRPVRQAWGLASDGPGWALVGLSLQKTDRARVHVLEKISASGSGVPGSGLGDGLRQVATRSRLSVALAAGEVMTGVLELPSHLPRDDWASEVQLEVAQLLDLAPEEVNFDFHPDPVSEGLLSRVHWAGCDQARIRALKADVRTAGWQLDSVEPAWHAAHRAAARLQGGMASLLTQAPQDWQFDLVSPVNKRAVDVPAHSPDWGDWAGRGPDLALSQAMQSVAGPRLVACGLALKAWLG